MSPTSEFITPGRHVIEVERVEVEEVWWMGHVIETREVLVFEDHEVMVPDPGFEDPEDHPTAWPARGTWEFMGRQWTVVRGDDVGFWGWDDEGRALTKDQMLQKLARSNEQFMARGEALRWWDLDAQRAPLRPAVRVSIQDMLGANKTLMAHLLVDLGLFKSVSEAKRNGWDRPLEPGRHDLGPRKKRVTVELVA